MKVYFIGAGPGAPDLMTLRGKRLVEEARVVIYSGSLVNPEILRWAAGTGEIHDSSAMSLGEVTEVYHRYADEEGIIARLHTGDPAIYGAIQEQIDYCDTKGIPWEVIPGVSSVFASAAALGRELTLPGVTQTVTIGRIAGRTPVPDRERLESIACHGGTLALLLSVSRIQEVVDRLVPIYGTDTPAAVVYRASWPDQKIARGTLGTIVEEATGITRQAIILVGHAVGAHDYEASKLYDSGFSHGYRRANQ